MAKQTTLAGWHNRHGVTWQERDSWLLPDHFGNPEEEYRAVRNAVGLIDLSQRAMLQFTGPDRLSFLQGMLSNDLRALRMFEGQSAALLTQQGKVVAGLRVLCAMNSFYVDFWEPLKEKIINHLNRYLVADEVEIQDPNDHWKMLSLQGPRAASVLNETLAGAGLPDRVHQHAMIQFDGGLVCVVHADRYGAPGYDIIVQTAQLEKFAQTLTDRGAPWVGEQAQNILRVENGLARYGVDFDEDNLLLEVGLDDAVSFSKGCYLGQEVVERIRSRGHVNKKLCGLLLDGNTAAVSGDKIFASEKEVGHITCSVQSPALQRPIALGYLNKDFWQPGMKLDVHRACQSIGATVTPRPLLRPA
ncbi:MAG: aminomethyl transferase family protein [Deltaproteobacteria bacterium]|nr:aminomethyl transferase family protein [Deltaproteobacteria bacterium]